MPIFVGGQHINKPGKDEPHPIVVQRLQEVEPTLEVKREKVIRSLPSVTNVETQPLINYKQSSFISDMLSDDKE